MEKMTYKWPPDSLNSNTKGHAMSVISWLKSLRLWSRGLTRDSGYTLSRPNVDYSAANEIKSYHSWVFVAASKNASSVASTPLRLYSAQPKGKSEKLVTPHRKLSSSEVAKLLRENPRLKVHKALKAMSSQDLDVIEITEHPFIELMGQINPMRSTFEFFEETQLFLDLTGDAYWLIENNSLGIPVNLYLLPSQYVTIVPSRNGFVDRYEYGINPHETVKFKPDQVIHIRVPNPADPWYGKSCVDAAWRAIKQYGSMVGYETALNENLGIPSLLISYEGTLTPEDAKRIEADWNKSYKGVQKQGKIKVGDSNFKVTPVGMSPRDMSFQNGRKWTRLEIADAFGVPIALLDTENVNKANSETANYQYQQFTILPRLRRIQDKINENLLSFYDDQTLFVVYDNPVPEDDEFKLKETTELTKEGIITFNEARRRSGYDPLETGNVTSLGMKEFVGKVGLKPLPNEHVLRLLNPASFSDFRRQNDAFGEGIDVIWGIKEDGKTVAQSLHFKADKWTLNEALEWAEEHNYKPISVEPASGS